MESIHVRAVVQRDGSLLIKNLPFPPGEEVEVTVQQHHFQSTTLASLEGSVLKYIDPTAPVAEDDWEVLR